jgi:cytosine/adenosine deaminase-related metal-dependent hydrolase
MSNMISETAQAAGLLDRGRPILIRKARLITMDDEIGDMLGDVLVKDGKIAEVGRDLVCEGAAVIDGTDRVVIPGFVNSHIHLWQTVIKGCAGDWSFGEYLQHILGSAGKHYRPEDVRVATLLGALELDRRRCHHRLRLVSHSEHARPCRWRNRRARTVGDPRSVRSWHAR